MARASGHEEDASIEWPADWPDQSRRFYERIAEQRDWPASTLTAVVRHAQMVRDAAVISGPRRYLKDEFEGVTYLFELAHFGGHAVVTRQIESRAEGFQRYWWERIEDDESFLAEIDGDEPMEEIGVEEFNRVWDEAGRD